MKDKDKMAVDFAVALKTYCKEHAGCDESGCVFADYSEDGSILCRIGWDDEGECMAPMDWKV